MSILRFAVMLRPYVRTCICHIGSQSHNLGIIYAGKLTFGMLLTKTLTFKSVLELLLGHTLGWDWGSIFKFTFKFTSTLRGHNLGTF